ncbi:MAG TPA: penicillin-binding transpeptidase domain-containing protein [Nocardioidaceae bacterium]|nr:penicillin-binding transpeptidase domain-containing protein [Nocardioidaceae bacterium]
MAGTGCSVFGGPGAEDAAEDLAAALSAGDVGAVAYAEGTAAQAQEQYQRTVAGLDAGPPQVRVERVDEGSDGGPSTARLAWSWRLPGVEQPWTYRTVARLEQGDDDAWQVRPEPGLLHPSLEDGERLVRTTLAPDRGDVLGAGGAKLVTERRVLRFGVDKARTPPAGQAAAARTLATRLGIDAADYVAQVRSAGPEAFVEALVLRPADARSALRRGAGKIGGVGVVSDTMPLAPTRDFARPVLGTVGPVTAEIVEASEGTYRPGDEAGLSGLQARYDEQLRGTPGLTVQAVNPSGAQRPLHTVDAVPGEPLTTTLDISRQQAAETALSDVRPASALVAVRPSTGDLLAVASGPGSEGYSTATLGQYAPGSTFKVVTSLALLRAGAGPSSLVSCPATTVVNGKRFKNYDDYPTERLGRIPLSAAVAYSCNTAFINEQDAVSQADLADAAASLGLGVDHDIGFPAYFGSVPSTGAEAGSQTGHAASMIGQGRVLASPLAMAAVAASVAKGGAVVPRLLEGQTGGGGEPRTPLTGTEARQLRTLMRGVVTQGSGSFLASVPGPPVLAKTGTAEFGSGTPLRTHAWMVAVRGDLAAAVFVDVGESGSQTAGPVLERFLRAVG